jgi:hypothetical protein
VHHDEITKNKTTKKENSMTEDTTHHEGEEIYVHNVRSQESESGSRMDSMVGLANNIVQLGVAVTRLGTSMLPRQSCRHFRNGLMETGRALISLPQELAESSKAAMGEWGDVAAPRAPRDEMEPVKVHIDS